MQAEVTTFRVGARRTVVALLAGLADIVLFLPLFACLATFLISSGTGFVWMLTLVGSSCLGVLLAARPKRSKHNAEVVIVCGIVAVAIPLWLHGPLGLFGALACGAAGLVVSLLGAHHWRTDSGLTVVPLYVIGLCVHFFSLVLFHHMASLSPWTPIITGSGLTGFGILCFAMNQSKLDTLMLDKDSAKGLPKRVVRYNRLLVLAFTGVVLLIFCVQVLQHEASRLWWDAVRWIGVLLQDLLKWVPMGARGQLISRRGGLPFPQGHHKQPVVPPRPLNHLEIAILLLLLCCLVSVLGWMVWRRLWPAWLAWYRRMMLTQSSAEAGYVDELEFIRTKRHSRIRSGGRRGSVARKSTWGDLRSPAEKVRYLYRTFVEDMQRRGYEHHPSLTASETTHDLQDWQDQSSSVPYSIPADLAENLERLYDAARYGERMVSDKDAEDLKAKFDALQNN